MKTAQLSDADLTIIRCALHTAKRVWRQPNMAHVHKQAVHAEALEDRLIGAAAAAGVLDPGDDFVLQLVDAVAGVYASAGAFCHEPEDYREDAMAAVRAVLDG